MTSFDWRGVVLTALFVAGAVAAYVLGAHELGYTLGGAAVGQQLPGVRRPK